MADSKKDKANVAAEAVNPDGSTAKVDAEGRPETHDGYDPDAKRSAASKGDEDGDGAGDGA